MKELMNVPQTMSSREIAQLTGKEHKNVLRDIENLNVSYEKLGLLKIEQGYYTHPNTGNQQHREFRLTKMQTLDLMTGYSAELRIKVNRRWAELEEQKQNPVANLSKIDLAQMVIESEREKERLQLQNQAQAQELQKQAPKVAYYNEVLQSQSTYNANQIAKELGMSAVTLNKKLQEMKVQYKQGGTWLLYHKYQNKGYTKTQTHTYTDTNGITHTSMLTVWTEEGRKFIHDLLKTKMIKTA